MSNSKISLIIPHWNGIDVLSECLDSLAQTEYSNFEIIVVDNASTDGSPDWVSLNFPQIKLIENNQNYGYAGRCNRGAKVASGDYLVFLNNDTVQEKNFSKSNIEKVTNHQNQLHHLSEVPFHMHDRFVQLFSSENQLHWQQMIRHQATGFLRH